MNWKRERADTNWECFSTILHLMQINCIIFGLIDSAVLFDDLLIRLKNSFTHKVFDRQLFTKCLVKICQVNFSGEIGVRSVLFCISDCFSSLKPWFIYFDVLPGLLEWVIGIILWRLLLFHSWLLRLCWGLRLLNFNFQVGRLLLWQYWSFETAVFYFSLSKFVPSDEIY